MYKLVKNGDIRYVGVSNFNAKQMRKANAYLKENDLVLASNQVSYNLFNRSIKNNGVLETSKELCAGIIAYSLLHQGLLTGKFNNNPELLSKMFWMRKAQYKINRETLKQTMPLINQLENIGENLIKLRDKLL